MVAIFVVMMIMAFVAVDLIVQNFERRKKFSLPVSAKAQDSPADSNLILPLGYFFHPGHTWARIEETGAVEVGFDDFAQKLIGSIDTFELPEVGKEARQGQPLFSIKQGGRNATFISPVNGTIRATNAAVTQDSAKKNPYRSGWVVKVESDSLANDLSKLKIGKDAVRWMKSEIMRFLDFSWNRMPAPAMVGQTAQDGGFPVEGILENMDDGTWNSFVHQFLQA